MSDDPQAQRRAHYRLRYPEAERPVVQANDRDYPVTELSEAGLRVVLTPAQRAAGVASGTLFRGFLRFWDDEVVLVRGEWLRVEGEEGIVHLTAGVTLRRMLDEQRRLIRKYPTLFEAEEKDDNDPGSV